MFDLLRGVRILDLTTIVLGPYATQILGDFGADVVKIESPNGDLFRAARPGRSDTMGAAYLNCNRNKRSLVIDLKSDKGKTLLAEMIKGADVLVHNMRGKAADKLGINFERVHEINPRLVYCTAPGFGSDGPYADDPAYDDVIQAASGLAALNTNDAGEPRFITSILCDKVSALHFALAVLAGLQGRDRTGEGSYIETPMFESVVHFLLLEQMAGRLFEPAEGDLIYSRLSSPYRKPYRTRDGFIGLLPYTSKHWIKFLKFIGQDELAGQEWVSNATSRSERINELYQAVSKTIPSKTTKEWIAIFRELDIPCAPVNSFADLFDDPHLNAVGFFENIEHPTEGKLVVPKSPFNVKNCKPEKDRPAPGLGEHGADVLADYGISQDQIDELFRDGVVKPAP